MQLKHLSNIPADIVMCFPLYKTVFQHNPTIVENKNKNNPLKMKNWAYIE